MSTFHTDEEPTYHNKSEAAYVFPNDGPEHERLDKQARGLLGIMSNQIIHAPIPVDAKDLAFLDVGCGTGIVTDYLAHRYKDVHVYGLDLSPVPAVSGRPTNITFLEGDAQEERPEEWRNSAGQPAFTPTQHPHFDFIYSRLLLFGLSNWPKYISNAFSILHPGGFLEIHEVDFAWRDGAGNQIPHRPWWTAMTAKYDERGLDMFAASHTASRMRDAGFVDVQVTEYRWPCGGQWEDDPSYKSFGEYVAPGLAQLMWRTIPATMGRANVTDDDVARMRREMMDDFQPQKGKHLYMAVVVGRKPD